MSDPAHLDPITTDVIEPPPSEPTDAPLPALGGSMDIVSEFKKGYKTSEFWVGLVALLAPPIAVFSGYEFDVEGATTVIGSVFAGIAYIGSRTWLKRRRLDAVMADKVG